MVFCEFAHINHGTIEFFVAYLAPKFGTSGLYDSQHSGHYSHLNSLCSSRESELETEQDPELQPKSSQYINQNCVLLSYFTGDASRSVDEHFTRSLNEPSSFNIEKKPLMCHRKLPPSFWNSNYRQPSATITSASSNFDYSRDPYLTPSWYSLQSNWPYRISSHTHTDLTQPLSYTAFDSASKLSTPYQSIVFPGSYDSRQSKYDFAKNMDSLAGTSSYYGLSRFGMDFPTKGNMETPVPGLEYQLQSARRELCW
ncbi:hypothetical protein KUTeg_007526 [Tegillarca granosa]|uniref:Uncharacterized protein n=1 Tax=Tegillarca granosa TaxID=220873 RepID=A0ABQ9FFH3_TEGGR|nr:hypothetical protein KUTeg_007526 [Tegillarca granosa]